MHLFLGLLAPFVLCRIGISLAAPGLFDDDGNDSASDLDIFSSDQADLDASAIEEPLDFTVALVSPQEDLGLVASNDELDWGTDNLLSYLDDGGYDNTNFQQDPDLFALTSSCDFNVPGTQGLNRKKRDTLPGSCPNPFSPDGDPSIRSQGKPRPKIEPAKPPTPKLGIPNVDHVNIYDFYVGRDRDTIRGYAPTKDSFSPCGKEEFVVCDSGDPYYRIPQIPPRYALERCFACMFDFFFAIVDRV